MKRLLFINGHMNSGGVERSLLDVLRHIDYSAYKVDLLLFEGVGDYREEIPTQVNVIFKDITSAYGSFVKSVFKSLLSGNFFALKFRLWQQFGLEFLLKSCFSFLHEYDAAVAYRVGFCHHVLNFVSAEKKLVWWHHGSVNMNPTQKDNFLKDCECCDKVVFVSEGIRRAVLSEFPDLEVKSAVVPNMIDSRYIIEKGAVAEERGERERTSLNLLSIGRFSPEKNYIICPYICRRLIDSGFNVRWTMVGDGVQLETIKQKVSDMGLNDSFCFRGTKENPYVYYNAADVFVHTSLVESQSITILESMACGVPVVTVKSIGPLEFMTDGENGFLCENNVDMIAEKISTVFTDKALRQKFIKNSEDTVRGYSPNVIMQRIEECLN